MGAFLTWTPDSGAQGSLYFDVVTTEQHEGSVDITEHPVEQGANVSDHARANLDKVTLEGFISNSPVYSDDASVQTVPLDVPEYTAPPAPTPGFITGAVEGAIASLFSGPKPTPNASLMTFSGSKDYVQEALDKLNTLKDTAQLIDVVTTEKVYHNMILESFTLTRSADTGDGGEFALSFKQLRIVESKIVAAPKPTEPRAQKPAPKGAKGTKDSADTKQSLLKKLLGNLTDNFFK